MGEQLFETIADWSRTGLLGDGVLVILIGVLVWTAALALVKAKTLSRDRVLGAVEIEQLERLLADEKIGEARALCRNSESNLGRMVLAVLSEIQIASSSERELRALIEESGRREVLDLKRHLSTLRSLASAGPLLGLLGTVFGMIGAFAGMAEGAGGGSLDNAAALSRALTTTAAGLVIAVPAIFAHNALAARANWLVGELEQTALQLVGVLRRAA